MIPEKEDLHSLGYFSKLHGYKGELTASLKTDNNKDYERLENIFVEVARKHFCGGCWQTNSLFY